MSHSLTYNGTDLSTYGLIVLVYSPIFGMNMDADLIQLPDHALASKSTRTPKAITLDVIITGADRATLLSYIDSIKGALNEDEACSLVLDEKSDRYWTARMIKLEGRFVSPTSFEGQLLFSADDPAAYAVSNTSSDFNINSDPDTVEEAVGGNTYVYPVYTLTAGENLTDVTIKLENLDTDEELQWTGSLANGEVLVVNTNSWLVTKEGTANMSSVTGQFPRLKGDMTNRIKVTAFSTTGTLNIAYRDKYI